jgi:hypothetical protein
MKLQAKHTILSKIDEIHDIKFKNAFFSAPNKNKSKNNSKTSNSLYGKDYTLNNDKSYHTISMNGSRTDPVLLMENSSYLRTSQSRKKINKLNIEQAYLNTLNDLHLRAKLSPGKKIVYRTIDADKDDN